MWSQKVTSTRKNQGNPGGGPCGGPPKRRRRSVKTKPKPFCVSGLPCAFQCNFFYRKRRAPARTSGIVGLLRDDQQLSTGDFQSGENHCCQNTRWQIVSPLRDWRTRHRGRTRLSATTKHTDGAVEANPRNFGLSCLGAATRATGNQETLTRNQSPVPLGTVQNSTNFCRAERLVARSRGQ